MRHVETMKGHGTMTSNAGEQVAVRYELHVYQDEIHAGTLDDPGATLLRNGKRPACVVVRRRYAGYTPCV